MASVVTRRAVAGSPATVGRLQCRHRCGGGRHVRPGCSRVRYLPRSGAAPGADDNASGSVAVLVAADILSQYQWGCTLRFALWTGEEQGWLGSRVYAARSKTNRENIKGYLNLDSIAWNSRPPQSLNLYWTSRVPASQNIADLFVGVIGAYGLDLLPFKFDAVDFTYGHISDNAQFWSEGYPAIWVLEDLNDGNGPIYHSPRDRMSALDMGKRPANHTFR